MKSSAYTYVCILLAMVAVKSCGAKIFRIEAESTRPDHPLKARSNASNKTDVRLHQNDLLSFRFCLKGETSVSIKSVTFSNDGGADKCIIHINGIKVGEFVSTFATNYSKFWNVFKSSGEVGSAMKADPGCNTITLFVTSADDYGIEIDHIEVYVEDAEVNADIFRCNSD
ncbi:hypothetical protein SNE40_000412 [Patella caerulea]|uniref:Uncharacterized protein n=1 Tax=Patella caerulea TaxID=87958 RepID=A0AAN8Q1H8_PATCE